MYNLLGFETFVISYKKNYDHQCLFLKIIFTDIFYIIFRILQIIRNLLRKLIFYHIFI